MINRKKLIEEINKKREARGSKPVGLSSFKWNDIKKIGGLLNERDEKKKIDIDEAIKRFKQLVNNEREIANEVDRNVIEEIKRKREKRSSGSFV